jgi:cytochrome c peroxidase
MRINFIKFGQVMTKKTATICKHWKRMLIFRRVFLSTLSVVFLASCQGDKGNIVLKKQVFTQAKKVFTPVPYQMPGSQNDTPERIALGKRLYFDARLSVDDAVSCNSCHTINSEQAGMDGKRVSRGALRKNEKRNTPTVFNAGFQFVQLWDGREKDLKSQNRMALLSPLQMGMPDSESVVQKIRALSEYPQDFEVAFPETRPAITFDRIREALAAFERTLITHDRFDNFLKGNLSALSDTEVKGLERFINSGCVTCHTGPLLGGNMFQKMGVVKSYDDAHDTGRYAVTGQEADMFIFKVAALRNIAQTAPYFHDGREADLAGAVKRMAEMQLGKSFDNLQTLQIVKFLQTLTGTDLLPTQP